MSILRAKKDYLQFFAQELFFVKDSINFKPILIEINEYIKYTEIHQIKRNELKKLCYKC